MISYGYENPLITHVVDLPQELWQSQEAMGKVVQLKINHREAR